MVHQPPSESNWHYTHSFDPSYAVAYDDGYEASKTGKSLDDNPYRPSGHERDTTYDDELHYWWYKGWSDYGGE